MRVNANWIENDEKNKNQILLIYKTFIEVCCKRGKGERILCEIMKIKFPKLGATK